MHGATIGEVVQPLQCSVADTATECLPAQCGGRAPAQRRTPIDVGDMGEESPLARGIFGDDGNRRPMITPAALEV
jgi:hypothetical protein